MGETFIFRITGWQPDEPHWHVAYVEAPNDVEALAILLAKVVPDDGTRPETVRKPTDPITWKVEQIRGPLLFVLGAGCR